MSIIRLQDVHKRFAGVPVLEGASLRVEEGEKVGLVGRNGTGKTTIFRLITGETEPDGGTVERQRRSHIAHLVQLPQLEGGETIMDIAMRQFSELVGMEQELEDLAGRMADDHSLMDRYSELQDRFALRGGYEFRATAKRVLTGLGFREDEFGLPVKALSGGQRTRLQLALVLLEEADLLLLDEPENHLDLEMREWLEEFLRESKTAFVMISHDRHMLNSVVDRIVEVERGKLEGYTGNYDAYLEMKNLKREQQQRAYEQQQKFIERETAWVDRFRSKARRASQAQSRLKRLERLDRVEAPPPESKTAALRLKQDVERAGATVVFAEGLSMGYDSLTLYEDVSFRVERGERVGIVGPNGSGKTTLLRHIAGRLEGGEGEVRFGHKVTPGFYQQHHEDLSRGNDIFTEVRAEQPEMTPEQVRTFLGRFLFTEDDAFKRIDTLSGGELSRVAIAKLILSGANLLLLDEPTNHLDIASREALEAALREFPGSILLVSHDRTLIDDLVSKVVVLEGGKAVVHLGNYTDYRRRRAERKAEEAEERRNEDALRIRDKSRPKKPKAAGTDEARRRQIKKDMGELESDIESVEEEIARLEAESVKIDPSDYVRAQEVKDEYEGMKSDLASMYAAWEELAAELDG